MDRKGFLFSVFVAPLLALFRRERSLPYGPWAGPVDFVAEDGVTLDTEGLSADAEYYYMVDGETFGPFRCQGQSCVEMDTPPGAEVSFWIRQPLGPWFTA